MWGEFSDSPLFLHNGDHDYRFYTGRSVYHNSDFLRVVERFLIQTSL